MRCSLVEKGKTMTVKEKLVEIIENAGYLRQYPGTMARILIENGVTFATDNNDGCKWIPVAERLPDGEELVMIHCKNGAMFVGYCGKQYCDYERRWRIKTALNSTKLLNLGRVTHWMPLPEPPKEGVNDGK